MVQTKPKPNPYGKKLAGVYFVGRQPSLLQITSIATKVRPMILKTRIITMMVMII